MNAAQPANRYRLYETPSDSAPLSRHEAKRGMSPNKIALTEVEQSEGDRSPPDYEENMSPTKSWSDVPEDLRNLDENENIDDTLELSSMLSHRKAAAKHKRRVHRKGLYSDLTKVKRPAKEQSR